MIVGKFPFNGSSEKELFKKISSKKYEEPDFLSSEIKDLFAKIFVNEETRLNVTEIL